MFRKGTVFSGRITAWSVQSRSAAFISAGSWRRHAQERTRTAAYSPELLLAAKRDPALVAQLERTYATFLADGDWRTTLPPMPRAQRRTAHALAEQWGFTSASTKPEPGRCVEIFKNAKSARPSRCTHDPRGVEVHSAS